MTTVPPFLSLHVDALQNPSTPPTTDTSTTAPTGNSGAPTVPQQQPWFMTLLPIVLIIAVFYFVLLRPEKKQRQKREELLKSLQKGQRVLTTSGIYGTVAMLNGDQITLQVDEGVRLKFARAAIQQVLNDDDSDTAAKK